jgi:hypothetical protein
VTEGHLQALDASAALTYLFLCTVGNREGISFWSRPRMAHTLHLPVEAVDAAMQALVAADLIAATQRIVQVLPVPSRGVDPPVASQGTASAPSPLPPDVAPLESTLSEEEIGSYEDKARALIATFYGKRKPLASVVRALARSLALKERS